MQLNNGQRMLIADKLMDSANYALAGLVFGQLITERFNALLLFLGLVLYVWGWSVAIQLRGNKKRIKIGKNRQR